MDLTTLRVHRRTSVALAATAFSMGAALGLVLWRKRSRVEEAIFEDVPVTPTPRPKPETPVVPVGQTVDAVERTATSPRAGTKDDRGSSSSIGVDLDRLRARDGLEPVVQYLTYIAGKRSDGSHLLFVRYEDIDAMAALEGEPPRQFLDRLDQLGVVVSNN